KTGKRGMMGMMQQMMGGKMPLMPGGMPPGAAPGGALPNPSQMPNLPDGLGGLTGGKGGPALPPGLGGMGGFSGLGKKK
ncbi:MAG: signal recognition particle protein, partial [Pseudomonadota bacterium]